MLKSLHAALVSQWTETLYIPIDLLNKMALWLTAQQDNTTGAFIETADNYYDRSFWVSFKARFFLLMLNKLVELYMVCRTLWEKL